MLALHSEYCKLQEVKQITVYTYGTDNSLQGTTWGKSKKLKSHKKLANRIGSKSQKKPLRFVFACNFPHKLLLGLARSK